MLRAEALTKRYGPAIALEGLNLEVVSGEIVALLGANGAGKTTTLNLFLGFLSPSSGRAWVGDIEVAKQPAAARARLAYVPEVVALYDHLTGLENVEYFVRLGGGPTPRRSELEDSLMACGLPREAFGRRAVAYSKGMRQKVALAIALARRAQALLLDEPLSGLDPAAANDFVGTLRLAGERGLAVLMATHDVFRAKECARRVGILKGGRLIELRDTAGLSGSELEQLYLHHMKT
jgi:ABC-2 type transport system ATP-binding protein